jgi:hypothetical protein
MTQFESGAQNKANLEYQIKAMETIDFQDFYEFKQTREDFLEIKEALITLSDTYNKDDALE